MTRTLLVLVLIFTGRYVFGQTVTDINTRGKQGTKPAGQLLEAGGRMGGDDTTTLRAVFTIDNPANLKRDHRFDYELVITNRGNKALVIPQCLNWEDVDTGSRDQRFVWASVGIKVRTKDDLEGELNGGLTLYGAEDRPSSELVLKPGESVRILASVTLPISMSINHKPIGEAKLVGVFHVGNGWLYRTPTRHSRRISRGDKLASVRGCGGAIPGKPWAGAVTNAYPMAAIFQFVGCRHCDYDRTFDFVIL